MSMMVPHEIQCPECDNSQEVQVWESVNVSLDPDLKDKVYSAEINLFNCEECGHKAFIDGPLLYHDMDQQFCVQYYPKGVLEDENFFNQFKVDGSLVMDGLPEKFSESGTYLVNPHIVFDMNELVRYIAFRDTLVLQEQKKE